MIILIMFTQDEDKWYFPLIRRISVVLTSLQQRCGDTLRRGEKVRP